MLTIYQLVILDFYMIVHVKNELYPLSRTFKILVIHNFGQLKFKLPHSLDMA
jgi:hypothetical protein